MKTRREIIERVAKINGEHNMLTLDEALGLAVDMAREEPLASLREVDRRLAERTGYTELDAIRTARQHIAVALTGTATPLAASPSPQFAPEGEPDYYRGQWRALKAQSAIDTEGRDACHLKITSSWGETKNMSITPEDAEHFLAYLSERNRSTT